MTPFVLAVLKYALIALIYFFVYRAIKAVTVEVAGRRAARSPRSEPRAARGARGRSPTTLVVRDDAGKKLATHRLDGAVQIGRADACHVRLDDTYVSQFHARIYPRDGAWYVEDLGSTNGTYLNRERVTGQVEIQSGDQVRVGKTTLELRR